MRRILNLGLIVVILAAMVAPVLSYHGVAQAALPTRGNTYIFAASNSSVADKALADTVCDGTDDQDDLEANLATDTEFVFKAGSYAWDDVATLDATDSYTLTGESGAHIYRNADTTGILVQDSDDVVINGLEMSDNGTSSLYYLIRFNGSTNVIVTGTTLHDMENGILAIANTTTHVKSSNVTIESNTIYNYHYSGVLLGNGVEYAYVQSNEFYDGTMTGSNLYAIATQMMGESDTTVPYVEYVWIQDNYIHDQDAWEGIDSHGGNHIYVLSNTVENVTGFGISVHTSMAAGAGVTTNTDWVITGNTVTSTAEFAVSVANTLTDFTVTDVEVSNNNINGWDWRGIHIQAEASGSLLQGVTVDSNVITNHSSSYTTGAGIHIYRNTVADATSGDITITNNTVNGLGATVNAYFGIRVQRMLSVYQANNTVTNCTVTISLEDCTLGTPTATLTAIAVTPASLTISVGNTQQFAATGTYSDNSTANITLFVTWTSTNPIGATIASGGLLTGVAAGGSTTITATYGGITSNSVSVTITAAATTTPPPLPTPTSTTNETGATVKSFNVYNSLLEPNDYLLVVYANIPYDPIPDDLVSETVIWRLFDSTNTNEYGYSYMYAYHDNGYGYNVVGFYFDNSTAPTWGESSYVRLQGNPAFFSEPPNFAWQLEASNYTSETTQELNRAALAALIIDISGDIAQRWDIAASTFLMEGETATVLSAAGQQFWRGAIYGLQGLCPNVFPYNLEMVDVDEGEREWETTYVASLSSQWAGTWVEDAQLAGATLFDLDYDLSSIILVFVLAAGALVGNIFLSADTWSGLSDAAIVMVGTSRLGLIDLSWVGMIAAICVVYIAIRVWGIGR